MPKASNFTSGGVQNRDTQNRRLGTIVTSIQDSKPGKKQISQLFSYCELINLLRNGTIVHCLWENKKTSGKSVFREAWSPFEQLRMCENYIQAVVTYGFNFPLYLDLSHFSNTSVLSLLSLPQ